MVFSLFKKAVKPRVRRVERKVLPIYDAIVRGLGEMEKQGCDRLALTLFESEPDPEVRGRWISGEETRYYPFEMLDRAERRAIRKHQHYTVVSLVGRNVGGVRSYPDRGVELFHRTAINPFLPRLNEKSSLRYVTKGGGYIGKDALVRFLLESEANRRWTPEGIDQRVKDGIQDYRKITRRLTRQAGVYDALENMEQRPYTPFEQIMINMRSGINKASKGGN